MAPQALFICFEADPDNYGAILNDPRIPTRGFRVEQLAITNRNEQVRFNVYQKPDEPENRGLGSLKSRHHFKPIAVYEVPGLTLDDYLRKKDPDASDLVLWIDVEGAALDVLQGAEQSLTHTSLLFIEVEEAEVFEDTHPRSEVVAFLVARGFREILYRPHRGNAVGDVLLVSRSLYDEMDLGAAIRRFGLQFPLLSAWTTIKQIAFGVLTRVPFFLRAWRWFKPVGVQRR